MADFDENLADLNKKEEIIKNKIKRLEKQVNCYTIVAWIFIFIGFIFVLWGVFAMYKPIDDNELSKLGNLGDFISGSVGSAWSLAGLVFVYVAFLGQKQQFLQQQLEILFNQIELKATRQELEGQKKEMQETRKEFTINRITNIIYSQLERYEKALEQFKILHQGGTYIGNEAIFFLDDHKKILYIFEETEARILKQKKQNNCYAMKIYSSNDKSIAKFSLSAYNSVQVLKETLLRSDLSIAEMNDLKNLFFRNLGFIQLDVLEDIFSKYSEYLDLASNEEDEYMKECPIDCGKLSKAYIFLKKIIEFRQIVINEENLDDIKKNWVDEFGIHA